MSHPVRASTAAQRYLGWGRLSAGLALVLSLLAELVYGAPWFEALVVTGGVLLVAMGLATSRDALQHRLPGPHVLERIETGVFLALLAGGVDEDVGYVAVVALLMFVLAGLRGRRGLRTTAVLALGAEVARQALAAVMLGDTPDLGEAVVGLGLSVVVGAVVAQMVDLAHASEQEARASEEEARHALSQAHRAISQLEAMHRVVAAGIGEREDDTLGHIVQEIASSVDVPYVSAVLVDDDDRPRLAATTEPGLAARDDIDPLAPGPFITGPLRRALEGRVVRATRQELDEHALVVAPRGDAAVHPLTRSNGVVIGALVSSVPEGRSIEAHKLSTLERLAAQTSLAIESARALRREADLADRYRELDRMKTDFIAITSHELRTPLTTVTGVADILHERAGELDGASAGDLLTALRRQTRRLARLVDDLRTVSLVDAGTLAVHARPTDVVATVHETVTALAEIDTKVDADPQVPGVMADPDRLAQVLTNLVVNGDQHGEGAVHLRVRTVPGPEVALRVWDDGPGIPPEHRTTVFERFSRLGGTNTHTRGSGLGLFIARELTEAMGGRIDVVDHASGSAFEVVLPANPNGQ